MHIYARIYVYIYIHVCVCMYTIGTKPHPFSIYIHTYMHTCNTYTPYIHTTETRFYLFDHAPQEVVVKDPVLWLSDILLIPPATWHIQ